MGEEDRAGAKGRKGGRARRREGGAEAPADAAKTGVTKRPRAEWGLRERGGRADAARAGQRSARDGGKEGRYGRPPGGRGHV